MALDLSRRAFAKGLLATASTAALPGCMTTNQATGRTSFTGFYSVEDEIALGRKEAPKLIQSFGGQYDDPKLQAYVTEIGLRVAKTSEMPDLPYQFTILNSPIVNAFAMPGGQVFISRGLLALASNEAEIAGVLSHECGHVNARHVTERISAAQASQIGFGLLSILVGSSIVSDIGNSIASAYLQSFSRDQEFEADTLGVRYMSRAGYEPEAMVTFLSTLRDHSILEAKTLGLPEGTVDETNIMSTHPRTVDRVKAAMVQAGTARPAAPVTGRNDYLTNVEGLMFGDDPREGVIIGNRFAHPQLRIAFEAPEGFRIFNQSKQVVARGPNGEIIAFDASSLGSARHMTDYIGNVWAKNTSFSDLEPLTVNGLSAATGSARLNTDKGPRDIRLVAIQRDERSAWRFQFLTPPEHTAAMNEPFRRTTYSFRTLTQAEAARIQPLRLKVISIRPGDTVEKLSSGMPYGRFNDEAFRLLNDIPSGEPLPPSGRVKIVVG